MAPRDSPIAFSRRETVAFSYPCSAKQRRAPARICSTRSALRSSEIFGIAARTLQNRTDVLYCRVMSEHELMPVKKSAVGALVLVETISVFGTRMTYLALPWFVLVTTDSPGKMSLVLAAEILPMAVLGIPSGSVVQRLGSRTTMLVADAARAPILASIPLLYAADVL